MMVRNKASAKKKTRHSSLIVRWVSIVSLTIMVSFVAFSIIIYTTVSQQSLRQQIQSSDRVIGILNQELEPIPNELQISNVMPALSPTTRRLLNGKEPNIVSEHSTNNFFNDDLLSSISNPDISVVVYNLHKEIVFSNGDLIPKYKTFTKDYKLKKVTDKHNQSNLVVYKKIISNRSNKLTGYIVVVNQMTYYNRLMNNLLHWMIIISIIAIVLFTVISYFIVYNVVNPIKKISVVAREVDDDPNSNARIENLKRNDELGELGNAFNKMLDRMQSYIEQQKEFVSDVSHELRTPVAVIEGQLNMLERWGKDDPKILNESILASLQEADRMKHLIQEMLDLTRAEQINIQYPNAITNVNEVLKRVVSDMVLVHSDFNIQLEIDDLPNDTKIKMYQGHLEQIAVILIDNAIKYSTNRKQVNISAGVSEDEVKIIVQDFGEGIAEEEQRKIFNRFYRVDKARTREKGGNGLGLSIAQKLVDSYHGRISVHSVQGQGSQFKIVFPLLVDIK